MGLRFPNGKILPLFTFLPIQAVFSISLFIICALPLFIFPGPALGGSGSYYDTDSEDTNSQPSQIQNDNDIEIKTTTPFMDRFLNGNKPILLEAGAIRFDAAKQVYTTSGRAVISQGDIQVSADNVIIDMMNKTVSAEGNVTLKNDEGRMTCDAVNLMLSEKTGVIVGGKLVVYQKEHNYYLSGRRIEKIGQARYIITDGSYSTCDCAEEKDADWFIEAEEIDLTIDGYAIVHNGRYYSFGNPVMWVPYGVFPAKVTRQSGFLPPVIGWSSDDGTLLGVPFFWAIGDHVDATIDTDYYSNRGLKEGFEYRYMLSPRSRGRFNLDYMMEDRKYGDKRWAISQEHRQNIWRRLYLRSNINMVSDNDYVVDFPGDINARYDRTLTSNVIVNNLWENFDLNVDFEHYDDLAREDNSYTWQRLPTVSFNGLMNPFLGPLVYKFDVTATNFYRQKVDGDEKQLDLIAQHSHPYYYLTDGQRLELTPELLAPLSLKRYAFLTPYAGGYGTFYQLNDRQEEKNPSRVLYFTGADLHTELERAFRMYLPSVRGIKHSFSPGVSYRYFPDAAPQDELPIFDGRDRHQTQNAVTYYFDNRLWLKLFGLDTKRYSTWKLLDLRLAQDYDFHEAGREPDSKLDDDEKRPFSPFRAQLDFLATTGAWLNKIELNTEADYNFYIDKVDRFNILGALGSIKDDAIGVEYRYFLEEDKLEPDLENISGFFQYTVMDFITFGTSVRYSFVEEYFIEKIYRVRFNSYQNCWNMELRIEKHELPEPELSTHLVLDITGLFTTGSSF